MHIEPIGRFLLAVGVIVAVCHLGGLLCHRIRQPPVIGEIAAGLLLGPTLLGAVAPSLQRALFPEEVLQAVGMAAQLGLVTFMFLLGSELRVDHVRGNGKVVWALVAGSILLPFLAGTGFALLTRPAFGTPQVSTTAYALFVGLAMSITALPVLARILADFRADQSFLGTLALMAAAVGDALAWAALTVILAVTGSGSTGELVLRSALALTLVLLTVFVVKPALRTLLHRLPVNSRVTVPALVVGTTAFAATTEVIGLHPVIGAFLFGCAMPRGSAVLQRASAQLRGFTVSVLLPLFFAGVAMKTAFDAFGTAGNWLLFAAALAVATVTKFVGASSGALLAGLDRARAFQLGALMNCRGVTELVVATVGLQNGFVNEFGYTVLVLIALVTTALTGPLARLRAEEAPQENHRIPMKHGGTFHVRQD
uniref:Putative transporter n=1 Tax=Lentzea aerocolonigenes TaxID=68170 RepID=Q8KRH5_LENAE|nr:putative transporter [Lentzea aerocolonigenes]